jgi:hypothetical protein
LAYFLPFRPSPSRTLGFLASRRPTRWLLVATALLHFQATTAFFPTACCLPTGVPGRPDPHSESASPKLHAPSAFPIRGALFLAPLRGARQAGHASRKCHPQGLATLSVVSATSNPGSMSQLPTLVGFSFSELLSPPR